MSSDRLLRATNGLVCGAIACRVHQHNQVRPIFLSASNGLCAVLSLVVCIRRTRFLPCFCVHVLASVLNRGTLPVPPNDSRTCIQRSRAAFLHDEHAVSDSLMIAENSLNRKEIVFFTMPLPFYDLFCVLFDGL